jgi:adenylate kinase family enzyme
MTIDDLGPRICIMGPSNSGKSTLAAAVGRARGLTPIHLDLLFHRPNTDWEPRPYEEFKALHDQAILGDSWAMEGNYARLLPQRLERATGVILLDTSTLTRTLPYFRDNALIRLICLTNFGHVD